MASSDCDSTARQKAVVFLDTLLGMPLILVSAIKGKGLRPTLVEITGLSDTRISQGNLDALSVAAQCRVAAHARAQAVEEGRRNGLSSEEVEARILQCQELSKEPWELLAWLLMVREAEKIPHARAIGRKYGRQLAALFESARADRFDAFRSGLSPAVIGDVLTRGEDFDQERLDRYRVAFDAARSWESALPLLGAAADVWLLDFFAAMDAEWGQLFFDRMRPAPYFLWVALKTPVHISGKTVIKTHRNMVHRPVRRLLELSHALMERKYRGAWPDQPVGRLSLGRDADLSDALIGNYFDGTKVLRVSDYFQMWREMYLSLSSRTPDVDCPTEPMALLHVALLWQRLLVKTGSGMKIKSFTILDEGLYRACWRWHLGKMLGQPSSDVYDWPDWLVNQSLSSSASDSCQS